jgi:hypothetical protein
LPGFRRHAGVASHAGGSTKCPDAGGPDAGGPDPDGPDAGVPDAGIGTERSASRECGGGVAKLAELLDAYGAYEGHNGGGHGGGDRGGESASKYLAAGDGGRCGTCTGDASPCGGGGGDGAAPARSSAATSP